MKKFLIGAVAAIIATTGFVSTASADRYHNNGWRGHHYAYGHRNHHPRVTKRVVVRHGCVIRTVKRVDAYGNVRIKRVRAC